MCVWGGVWGPEAMLRVGGGGEEWVSVSTCTHALSFITLALTHCKLYIRGFLNREKTAYNYSPSHKPNGSLTF